MVTLMSMFLVYHALPQNIQQGEDKDEYDDKAFSFAR